MLRVFNKDPKPALALRIGYSGGMSWQVASRTLITSVSGGIGQDQFIDLSQYTIAELADFIAAQPGYSVLYETTEYGHMSAKALITASGSASESNGDHLYIYTSVLWAYMDALGGVLGEAKSQIAEMVRQVSLYTAVSPWLDDHGSYYGVRRDTTINETDILYRGRIIAAVSRAKSNNVALEIILADLLATAPDQVTVTDAALGTYGSPTPNGNTEHYAEFDVVVSVPLSDANRLAKIQDTINKHKAAGTRMKSIAFQAVSAVPLYAVTTMSGCTTRIYPGP